MASVTEAEHSFTFGKLLHLQVHEQVLDGLVVAGAGRFTLEKWVVAEVLL